MRIGITSGAVEIGLASLRFYRVGPGDPTAVVLHATGLNAGSLLPFVETVAGVTGRCLLVPDLRGHGRTGAHPSFDSYSWPAMARDIALLVERVGVRTPMSVVGHSMGGAVGLLLAAELGDAVRDLVLVEPALRPGGWDRSEVIEQAEAMAQGASRRRGSWTDRQTAVEHLSCRAPYTSWAIDPLSQFLRDGLDATASSEVRLRCEPSVEAQVYRQGIQTVDLEDLAGRCRAQVHVIVGGTSGRGQMYREVAAHFKRAAVSTAAGVGHFAPQEGPDLVGALVARCLVQAQALR